MSRETCEHGEVKSRDDRHYEKTGWYCAECDERFVLASELEAIRHENDLLRGLLAKGEKDCVYCGLPAEEISKCLSGFPGCSRMDDIVLAPITKAESENEALRLRVSELEGKL